MREITCDMCMDLMPLVQDGVASEDSVLAVEGHIQKCPKCKAMFEGELHVPSSQDLLRVNFSRTEIQFPLNQSIL